MFKHNDDTMLTPAEATEYLKVGRDKLYRMSKKGHITRYKFPRNRRCIYYKQSELASAYELHPEP